MTKTSDESEPMETELDRSAQERLIIVSNRLPYRASHDAEGHITLERSVGGLASGLGPLHEQDGNLWIGWMGDTADFDEAEQADVAARLAACGCLPVLLDPADAKHTTKGFRTQPFGRCSTDSRSSFVSTKQNGKPTAASMSDSATRS